MNNIEGLIRYKQRTKPFIVAEGGNDKKYT